MTVHSGKKQPDPRANIQNGGRVNDPAFTRGADGPDGAFEGAPASSPHLEDILGKIHAIMAQGAKPAALHRQGEPELDVADEASGRFEAREPMNLLAPYSEVLKDVRDYFKDRHSLDPQDRLSEKIEPPSSGALQGGGAFARGGQNRFSQPDFGRGEGRARRGGPAERVNDAEIFSPVQFEGSLSSHLSPSEVMGTEKEEIQVFRRELMSRISQLEQVIGHHFGNQKALATEAARSAVEMTLHSLDQTPIGQRLAALEAAFLEFKAAQNQLESHVTPGAGAVAPGQIPPLPQSLPQPLPKAGGGAEDGAAGLTLEALLKSDNRAKEAESMGALPKGDSGKAETRLVETPLADVTSKGGAGVDPALSGDEIGLVEPDHLSMSKLSGLFKDEADERLFGKKDAGDPALPSDEMGASPSGEVCGGDDPYAAKSAALRAKFKASTIVTKRDEIEAGQQRLARPAIVFITFLLLLAAAGIAYGDRTFADLKLFKDHLFGGGTATETPLKTSALKADQDVAKGKTKAETLLRQDELSITGNIQPLDGAGKMGDRLSGDFVGEETRGKAPPPETLLPMSTDLMSLPPAGIGPYSLRHAASRGDVNSQYEVARRFALGQGVEQNYEEAVRWYMQAAAKGFAPAQYRLATLYERGKGVERSLQRAKIWYQRAAELGNVKAMHNLAVVNAAINRDNPNYQTSIFWFKQAASYNLADSQFNLAILYQNGVGVTKNLVEAYRWYSLAARHGDNEAAKRRDQIEKQLKKSELLLAANVLQAWSPLEMDPKANQVGLIGSHVKSTMSYADETVSRSRVLTAQILLRKLGYKIDEADGVLNERTVLAIKKFELEKGLSPTGEVSPALLKLLNKAAL